MTPDHAPRCDRRSLLIAMGAATTAAFLPGCGRSGQLGDPNGVDRRIRPQDDLYRHINGPWLREYRLPPDRTSFGTFHELNDQVQQHLKSLIDDIRDLRPGTDAQRVRDLYNALLDSQAIEEAGIAPLGDLFELIDQAATKPDLAYVIGGLPRVNLIGIEVGIDPTDSGAHIAVLGQAGLGVNERYYRRDEDADVLAAYRSYLHRIAEGAGISDPYAAADRVVGLESRIAEFHWDNVRTRDPAATSTVMSWSAVNSLAPQFDWHPWLAGVTDRPRALFENVVVRQPSFLTGVARLWSEVESATWKEYLKLALIRAFAADLPRAISDADFGFYRTELAGATQRPEAWKRAVDTINRTMGHALGKLYVAQHFSSEARRRAIVMVDDIRAAYLENLLGTSWMSPPTRAAAIAKLDKITAKVGYPDAWDDYSALTITRGRLIQSLRAIETWRTRRDFARLGTRVDTSQWTMAPQFVNAYYEPTANEIVFPAAFLQPPFFDPDAGAGANYGAGGAIVGHEIGHAFDDHGAQYDGDGILREWWTPADKVAFRAKTEQVIAQYTVLIPQGQPDDQHVNGALTVGENLADLRGLAVALSAYRVAQQRDGIPNPDFSPVFAAWARTWRSAKSARALETQIATDPHAPAEFRCNQVVRNMPEFYTTYGVIAGDRMYLPPDERVTI